MRPVRAAVITFGVAACWFMCSRTSRTVDAAASAPRGARPQLLNPAVFGQPTSEPVRLLRDKAAGEAEPLTIRIDPRCGRYTAMDALYPPEVSEATAREAIGSLYGAERLTPDGKPSGIWRIESQGFSIMVTVEREGSNKGDVHVWLVHFADLGACSDPVTGPLSK